MRDRSATTGAADSAGPSSFHLRVGVLMVLLWMLPFWWLAPGIARALNGLSNPPSIAAVTATIVVGQTIVGLVGLWLAGTQVKAMIKGNSKRQAVKILWSVLLHGNSRGQL